VLFPEEFKNVSSDIISKWPLCSSPVSLEKPSYKSVFKCEKNKKKRKEPGINSRCPDS